MNPVKVVCGIIFKDNRVLICRRKADKSLGGYWEFPGGKLEDGETEEECLKRELAEELGLEVTVEHHFMTNTHKYNTTIIELISFICTTSQTPIKLIDHDNIEWVPTDTLLTWHVAPADIPIAKKLIDLDLVS